VVIAIAASGTTPFTVAALQQTGSFGAVTIGVANNPGTALLASAKFPILIETGRELIAGSTRMKAGTAQKVVLNLISSGIMLRLGRVYRGMMVNMQPTNAKLKRRAEAMVAQIAHCDPSHAGRSLEQAGGDIKTAGLLALGVDRVDAETILKTVMATFGACLPSSPRIVTRIPRGRRRTSTAERLSRDDIRDGERKSGKARMSSPKLFVTAPPRATSHSELGLAPPRCASCAAGELWACRGFLKTPCRDATSPPVSASAPSVITAFRTSLMLRHALFIVISQSGRSPDLIAATRSARRGRPHYRHRQCDVIAGG
jgi:D-arabinose 5-phosphate isomerase GutQ